MSPILSIKKLSHSYQEGKLKKQVLFEVNLEINSQEVVILTGESGSGKTTLLSLIGAMRSVQEGSLKVLDCELYGASKYQQIQLRRRIGYIFQHFNLLDFMNVQQNVQISLELQHGFSPQQAKARSAEIIAAVGLADRLHALPRDLSGGQKQRVAIARALAHNPPLLLADEPTAALDRNTGQEIIETIVNLAKSQGSAVIIVTHDNRIFSAGDRIVRIEDGRLNLGYQDRLSVALPTLNNKQLIELIPELKMATYQPNEVIIRQGDIADKFYIIVEGQVEVIRESVNGETEFLAYLGVNNFFGEVGLLNEVVRTATVRATNVSEVRVIEINRAAFHNMLKSSSMTHAVLQYRASELVTSNFNIPPLIQKEGQ